jgi:hypothetical protein
VIADCHEMSDVRDRLLATIDTMAREVAKNWHRNWHRTAWNEIT